MSPYPLEYVQDLELNAWPDLLSLQRGDWRLRLAAGFTGRANAVTPLRRGATLSEADLADFEAIYARHGLPTTVRITGLAGDGVDDLLAAHGYDIQTPSEIRAVDIGPQVSLDATVRLVDRPSADWIETFGRLNGRVDFKAETMVAILARLLLPARFAVLIEDGAIVAVGMAAVDRTLMEVQSIAVDPACRGRGVGRRMVASLLAGGRDTGVKTAFLTVGAANAPAIRLYSNLGFTTFGRYHYRVKPLALAGCRKV